MFHGDTRREAAATDLVRRQFEVLEDRYGTRAAAPASGEWLPYHNASHAATVYRFTCDVVRELAESGEVGSGDVPLARIAAVFHDAEQDLGSGANERASAEAAVEAMRTSRYEPLFSADDYAKVTAMILATTVSFDDTGMLHQSVDKSAPADSVFLQQAVVDADLSSLGAADGVYQGLLLFAEFQARTGTVTLPREASQLSDLAVPAEALCSYLDGQARLFAGHRFALESSGVRLDTQREENAGAFRDLLSRAQGGASFGELLAQVSPAT